VVLRDEGLGIVKGEVGTVTSCDAMSQVLSVTLADRVVAFDESQCDRLSLASCLPVHRTQGSQYACVVLVFDLSHYVMLQRAVLYTGMTRATQRFVYIGNPKALYLAVKNQSLTDRCSGLFADAPVSSSSSLALTV
jgi:exodeoxyribonuclease V alpha subunit